MKKSWEEKRKTNLENFVECEVSSLGIEVGFIGCLGGREIESSNGDNILTIR